MTVLKHQNFKIRIFDLITQNLKVKFRILKIKLKTNLSVLK